MRASEYDVRAMGDADADDISRWRYPEPYSFYDTDRYREDLEVLLDPNRRSGTYFSAFNEAGDLAGFFEFTRRPERGVVEIGLGLRPDLTGGGLGLGFVEAGVEFARREFSTERVELAVATFNERAIKVYERAGFRRTGIFIQRNPDGDHEFLRMRL